MLGLDVVVLSHGLDLVLSITDQRTVLERN